MIPANQERNLSRRTMAAYSIGTIGTGFFYAFNNAVLPLLIPSNNVLLVNLLSNTRSVEGAIIQPIIGAWSDRIWTPLGRRRPFMLIGIVLSALFMAVIPIFPSLAATVASIFFFSLFFNVAADPYTALQADIAPPAQRPTLNAVATVVQLIGQVGLTLFLAFGPFGKTFPLLIYPIVAAVILITFVLTIATVPERRATAHLEAHYKLREYLAALQHHHLAFRYLTALFFYNVGINTIQVNLTRFATHVLGVSDSDALKLFMILILLTGLLTVPAAWLAKRFGMKNVIIAGMVLIAIAAVSALFVTTLAQVLPAMVLAGAGNACLTLSWPLLTLLVPPERIGVFAGLKTGAESISTFFSSFVAAAMVGAWGYRSIFLVLLVAIVASLLTLQGIRVTAPALTPATQQPR